MKIDNSRKAEMRMWGSRRARRGQSLVEFALTLPVLLTIVAGVVEVSNILLMYNRVQLAAREGARFGAMGGTNSGVLDVVQQASDEALLVADDRMRVWVIRPTVQATGSPLAFSWAGTWDPNTECVYPVDPPAGPGCTDVSPLAASQVLNDLKVIGGANAGNVNGTRFVVVVVQYDVDTLLNLPWFSPPETGASGRFQMWAYAILRQEVEQTAVAQKTEGCSSYPIAVNLDAIPGGRTRTIRENTIFVLQRNELNNADDDYFREGWGFVSWRVDNIDQNFVNNAAFGSLRPPGNSKDATYGYVEYPNPPLDTSLHRGDWVAYNRATLDNSSWAVVKNHIDDIRELQIIIYDYAADVSPGYFVPAGVYQYQIVDFARVYFLGEDKGTKHNAAGGDQTEFLAFKWVDWTLACGYDE